MPVRCLGAGKATSVEETVAVVDAHEEVGEDDGDDGHELHDDVERGPRGVLERVAHRVAHHHRRVRRRLLACVHAHAPVRRLDALVSVHDLVVPGRVALLDVGKPRLDVDSLVGGAVPLLRHALVAAVAVLGGRLELGLVHLGAVTEHEPAVELALLRVLLGVVPGAARVGHADRELHRRYNRAGEQPRHRLHAAERPDQDRSEDDEQPGGDHLAERRLSCDVDARLVVGLDELLAARDVRLALVEVEGRAVAEALDVGELVGDVLDHGVGRLAHRAHRQRREPVRHHGAKEHKRKHHRRQQVHALVRQLLVLVHVVGGARHERAEERERHERSGADGKALADGSRGVAGSVERVRLVAHLRGHFHHFGDATGVVGDGAVDVDGEAGGERREHAQRRQRHPVHARRLEREEDDGREDDDGEDGRLVAKREPVDDVGCRPSLRRPCHVAHRLVAVGGEELSDEADEAPAPKTSDHAEIADSVGDSALHAVDEHGHRLGKSPLAERPEHDRHHDRGQPELDLEGLLDVRLLADRLDVGGNKGAHHAHDDAERRDEEGEDQSGPAGRDDGRGSSANEHGGARGFAEGTEEIRAHARDVAHVISDVVGDASGVVGRILVELLAVADANDLARQIGANIGSLGEDSSSHTPEHGDGRAAKTIASDALKEAVVVRLSARIRDEAAVEEAEDVQDHEREGAERVAHHPSCAEGSVEALHPSLLAVLLRRDGRASVGEHRNHHTDVSGEDGCQRTNHERQCRERTGREVPGGLAIHGDVGDEEKDEESEAHHEDEADLVLRPQEGLGARPDRLVDSFQLFVTGCAREGLTLATGGLDGDRGDAKVEEDGEKDSDGTTGEDENIRRHLCVRSCGRWRLGRRSGWLGFR
mmetsp:Transcript_45299/g.92485  ORF Transcript_45299/g.92485 Transcript_45299/m.92485 type:complete len:879 (+) Transcript_45299:186-2822(+)